MSEEMQEGIQVSSGEIDQVKAIARHEAEQRRWLQNHIETLNARIKQLEDDFFKEAFCASLGGYRANPAFATKNNDGDYQVPLPINIIERAILDAQEAVRQVGELNKEQNNV